MVLGSTEPGRTTPQLLVFIAFFNFGGKRGQALAHTSLFIASAQNTVTMLWKNGMSSELFHNHLRKSGFFKFILKLGKLLIFLTSIISSDLSNVNNRMTVVFWVVISSILPKSSTTTCSLF